MSLLQELLLTELTNPVEKTAYNDRTLWAKAAASAAGKPVDNDLDVVKKGSELVARWRASSNTGWVQQSAIAERTETASTLRRKLTAAQSDLDDLPTHPDNQAGCDALEDAHKKVKSLKLKLKQATTKT